MSLDRSEGYELKFPFHTPRNVLLHAILTKKARIIYYASLYLKFFGLVSIIYSLVLVVVLFVLGYHWIDGMIFLVRHCG